MGVLVRLCLGFVIASAVHGVAIAGTWGEAEAEIAACFQAMDRDPALAVVNAKFARRNPSAAQLADASYARDEEAEALRLRVRKTRPCRDLRLAAVKAHHPLLEPAYTALYYQADQVFAYLQQGAITYGAANRLSAEALALFQSRERAYFAADAAGRKALAETWLDEVQRAHSNPPPPPGLRCAWAELNIVCS